MTCVIGPKMRCKTNSTTYCHKKIMVKSLSTLGATGHILIWIMTGKRRTKSCMLYKCLL